MPGLLLMEHASLELARHVAAQTPVRKAGIALLCGKGIVSARTWNLALYCAAAYAAGLNRERGPAAARRGGVRIAHLERLAPVREQDQMLCSVQLPGDPFNKKRYLPTTQL